MPRAPRIQFEGGLYHLTSRGVRRLSLFADHDDRRTYLTFLGGALGRFGWLVHSYCLMPNHVHLLVETSHPNLSEGVQWLHGRYAQHVNHRHLYDGHAFDRRFHSRLVERESHLLEAVRYISLNPVRAGLCTRPEAFEWSSYRELLGLVPPALTSLDRVLGFFADDRELARRRLAAFVADRMLPVADRDMARRAMPGV
jgi:REP element-mobilizing transposase RayT